MEPIVYSKKELAIVLSKLKVFENPNVQLEQYTTDSEIAAEILWHIFMQNELEGKHVADLGCGTGILGIGALLLGARHVTFVEIDDKAIATLQKNLDDFPEILPDTYDIDCSEISQVPTPEEPVDIIIMNPPFGTRDDHADLAFLTKALELSPIVYSMHKTSTISYIEGWIQRNEAKVTSKWNYEFPIKQTYAHQTRKIMRIEVSCLRITRN